MTNQGFAVLRRESVQVLRRHYLGGWERSLLDQKLLPASTCLIRHYAAWTHWSTLTFTPEPQKKRRSKKGGPTTLQRDARTEGVTFDRARFQSVSESLCQRCFREFLHDVARAANSHVKVAYAIEKKGWELYHIHALLEAPSLDNETIRECWKHIHGRTGWALVERYQPSFELDRGAPRYLAKKTDDAGAQAWEINVACNGTGRCRRAGRCLEAPGPL
jgi:hypothetical protein